MAQVLLRKPLAADIAARMRLGTSAESDDRLVLEQQHQIPELPLLARLEQLELQPIRRAVSAPPEPDTHHFARHGLL